MPVLLALWLGILEPIDAYDIRQVHVEQGGYYASGPHDLYHWDFGGDLASHIQLETPIFAFFVNGDYFLISTFDKEKRHQKFQTLIIGPERQWVLDDFVFRKMDRLESGGYYGVLFGFLVDLYKTPHPFLTSLFDLSLNGDEWTWSQTQTFGKATENQSRFNLNWKECWLVEYDDGHLLVNQLDPRAMVYNRHEKVVERKQGPRVAPRPKAIPLDLPGFVPAPGEPFNLADFTDRKILLPEQSKAFFRKWKHGWSCITGFFPYGNGYLVAYEVPQNSDNTSDIAPKLGLRAFDSELRPLGDPLVVDGMFMGVFQNKAYVFEWLDPSETDILNPTVSIYKP